ncbi:MAG TPA: PA14 domain-containing protein [Verrucomicrobiae bacterium]|nr:PA14 domain-containing protein [Verrucomicrobiae bacterium]
MTTFKYGSQAGPKELARPIPTDQNPRFTSRMMRRIAACIAALTIVTMPTKAATIFKEAGGLVVIEAEHYTTRTTAAQSDDAHIWQVVPDEVSPPAGTPLFTNARGNSYITSQPDVAGGGANHNVKDDAAGTADAIDRPPFIDYKVNITTPGEYQLYMRWGGYDGSSDSIYAQIVELNATDPRWYRYARTIATDLSTVDFDGIAGVNDITAGGNEVPAVWTLAAGTYTLRISMREDGSIVDALVLQLSSLPNPGVPGPAESDLSEGFILGGTANAVALPPATATFNANAKAGPGTTITYQWQSKAPGAASFTDIAGATSASYTTPPTTLAMNGTQYRVAATSGGATLTSAPGTLTTDSTPPAILHAFSGPANTEVTVQFSEPVDKTTAETFGNYTIATGVTVSAAKLAADNKTVYLKTSAQTAGTSYTLTVNGVKDLPGNTATGATATFKGPVDVAGKLIVRKYEGVGGTAVAALLTDAKYPDQPTSNTQWSTFGGDGVFPTTGDNLGENYGLEVTGFIVPTVTANYVFYLSSDDASQLFLSTDESAANARLIARENGCCNQFTYAPGGLSSAVIPLEAGKRYYVRAYIKEGGGGDFLSVAWRNSVTDTDPTIPPTGQLEAIPTENLASAYDPSASVNITTQPASKTVRENEPYSFTVVYNAYSPLSGTTATVQWQSAPAGSSTFTDIAGATGNTYGGTFAKAAQTGTQYRAVVTSGAASATSTPATLTVSGSVPLVTLAKTIQHRFFANQTVNTIAGLRANPAFPNNPTSITFEPLFEYGPNASNEAGSNYGNRLSGWVKAPETGDYVFFTCSDDPSELWLSTDLDPVNKKLIATETAWSNARLWTSSGGGSVIESKRSDQFAGTQWPNKDATTGLATITLQAGQYYYIEVLHTEGGGGDNVGVAWKTPTGVEPVDSDPPISADFVDQLFAVTGTVTFNTQPAGGQAAANTAKTFTAAATASDGSALTYIWQTAPAGSTDFVSVGSGASYTTPLLTAADDNRQYRVLAFAPSGAGLSTVATLDVTADTVAPTVTYFTANRTQAQIVFSEPIDPTTAGALTSYSISGAAGASITAATVGTTPDGLGMVTLDLSGLNNLVDYTITIKDVKDTANNTMVQTTKTFKAYDVFGDFNGPIPPPKSTLTGSAKLFPNGSFDGSGMLELTAAAGSLQGTIGVDDVLPAATSVTKATAQFRIFVGNGSGNPADGYSFNLASDIDATTVNTGEEGTGTGLTIAFDTYDNGAAEAPAIDVKVGGAVIATTVGATPPVVKATLVNNQWVDVFIQFVGDTTTGLGKVTVVHNNVKYYDNLEVPLGSIDNPKVAIGARTGGELERHLIDNLTVIYNTDVAPPSPPTISITAPANNSDITAGGPATITVNAVASAGVQKVEFFGNGQLLGQSTTSPYSLTIPAVPPGYYSVTAKITDNNAVAVTSAPILVTAHPPASANAKQVLFIVPSNGPQPNASNIAEANHLFGLGYDVYVVGALQSVLADATGKAMIMISSTIGSGDVGDKFVTTTTPVLYWEGNLTDNFLQTLNTADVDHGAVAGQTTIDILPGAAGHKLAAGLSGTVTVTTAPDSFSWGLPTASTKQIATIAGNPARTVIFANEAGDTLIDGSIAAGRRVFFFHGDSTFTLLNANGLKLFDAAIDYAVNGPSGVVTTPQITAATLSGGNINITWTNGGTLEWTSALLPNGATVWTSTNDSDGSYSEPVTTAQMKIFRVRK